MPTVSSIAELCEHLEDHVEAIVSEWVVLASEEPWAQLEPTERLDDIRPLVRGILQTSLADPRNLDTHREKIAAAARHGRQRRKQGFDAPLLFAGYTFLREAMRRHLLGCGVPVEMAMDALLRIDIATTMASMASLRGFYREEHEALGGWERVLDEMARESVRLQPER